MNNIFVVVVVVYEHNNIVSVQTKKLSLKFIPLVTKFCV